MGADRGESPPAGLDIQVEYGGFRAAWSAVSENGGRWAVVHPKLVASAPEGIEQLRQAVDTLLHHACLDGLAIGVESDVAAWFPEAPRPCSSWLDVEMAS